MNTGIARGLNKEEFHRYTPVLKTVGSGGETQPVYGSPGGRYVVDDGIVYADIRVPLTGTGVSPGTGTAFAVSLPIPGARFATTTGNPNPYPIGQGLAYLSFTPSPNANVPIIPTLADDFISLGGEQDYWLQAFCPYVVDWGTGSIASASTSTTVNHNLGYAFNAADIAITWTGVTPTTVSGTATYWVSNITTTTFDVSVHAAGTGGGNLTFSWKLRAEPPTGSGGNLLGPAMPIPWSRVTNLGPFGNMFFQLAYPAR